MFICYNHFLSSILMNIVNVLFATSVSNCPNVSYCNNTFFICTLSIRNVNVEMAGRQKSKGTTQCPYCSCAVNNYNIGRHIASEHTNSQETPFIVGDQPLTPPPNHDNMNVRGEPPWLLPLGSNVSLSSDEQDSDIEDESDGNYSDIEDESDDGTDEDDEAEMTVEHYLRDLTDETYRTDIQYDPKRVLKYLSWKIRPLTQIEHETIRFLRCASFGNGLSKAHANEWLAYEREFGGRATLLPKSIDTLWSTMTNAHRSMCDDICRRTVEIEIPVEVHFKNIFNDHL